MNKHYDFLVIGSGPAGHTSAIRAAQLGLKVAVIEKDGNMFGGVCLNEGCIPAKSLYNSAKIFDLAEREAELFGLKIGKGDIDMKKLVAKSRKHADDLCKGLAFLFKKNGIDLIDGAARFIDKTLVEVIAPGGEKLTIRADRFLVATGSASRELSIAPFDGKNILSSSDAIRLNEVPKKILVVGGGAIGTEFASFFNIVGSDVTIVEMEESLLPGEDKDISKRLATIFKQRGINVLTPASLKKVEVIDGDAVVAIETKSEYKSEKYNAVIISVGRKPSMSVGLENVGVNVDEQGFVRVDERMRTNIENIYAAGDVVPTPMLAHMASKEGEVAAESAAGKDPEVIDYTNVPNAVYTKVQVASVGISEEKAKSENIDYAVGKQFFKANGRAVVNSETDGFIKIIADKNTHKLVGAHIIGYDAAELIHEFVVAKRSGLTVDDIEKTIHAHPTFSETAIDACRSVFNKPIHG